ncbi:TIGR03086 family metal-binding protein [Streptomyces sp. NPDC006703]|uniref:TIGR03086 family metal-binding protein n=1 Tax=Streptomyces sp. NPDC006703 TaxID=3364759 RepID=UPI0036A45207
MTETAHPATASAAASAASTAGVRRDFAQAVTLAGRTIAALAPDQYDAPTPCPDYTVRDLASHQVAVLRRVAAMGRGEDPFALPGLASDVADGAWHTAWEAAARETAAAWARPDALSRVLRLPFGALPGAAVLGRYSTEFTLHTWDLATATGQRPAWDPAVLAAAVAAMHRAVPAEPRGGRVPFGAVVDVAPDAPDIDRLVAWYGRRP